MEIVFGNVIVRKVQNATKCAVDCWDRDGILNFGIKFNIGL